MPEEILEDKVSKCCKSAIKVHIAFEGTGCYVCVKCGKACDPEYPDQFVDTNKKIDTSEQKYPCRDCGVLRTKEEGGTTFTVCDDCWDKSYKKPPRKKDDSKPPDECHCHQNCPGAHGGRKIGKDLSVSCLCYPRDCEHCTEQTKEGWEKELQEEMGLAVAVRSEIRDHKFWREQVIRWIFPTVVKFIRSLLSSQQQKFEKDLQEIIDVGDISGHYIAEGILIGQRQRAKQLGYSVES